MSDLDGLFNALYSKLLLRDIFGKIVPGSVVLLAVYVSFFLPKDSLKEALDNLQSIPFWIWLFFLGFAWVTAFAVQAIGETTGLIRYHREQSNEEFYAKRHKFNSHATEVERQELERLIVIKEACGNGYLAVSIAILTLLVDKLVDEGLEQFCQVLKGSPHTIALMVLLTGFLCRMHFIHVTRQGVYMHAIINKNTTPNRS